MISNLTALRVGCKRGMIVCAMMITTKKTKKGMAVMSNAESRCAPTTLVSTQVRVVWDCRALLVEERLGLS